MKTALSVAILAAIPLCESAAVAQAGDRLISAVTDCRKIDDPGARVACYDRAADALQKAAGANELTVMSREEVAQKRRSLFGLPIDEGKLFGQPARNLPPIETLDSTVTRRTITGRDTFAVTLADGSVWRTLERARVAPEVGDGVHVSRGAMKGYFASFRGARGVRVERSR